MGVISRIALALVIIGAINWGLIGFFQFDLVAAIFGGQTAAFARWVYALVGIGGLVTIPLLFLPDEDETSTSSATSSNGRKARGYNYQTEFAEEDEIIIVDEDSATKISDNKGTTSKKKKKK